MITTLHQHTDFIRDRWLSGSRRVLNVDPSAFSIVELLVSVVIIGLALAGIAGSWLVSSDANSAARARNIQEAAIDEDLAAMADLAYRYTCCPGTCTAVAETIAASPTCKGLNGTGTPEVGTEYYYHPYYAPGASTVSNIDAFAGSTDSSPRDGVYENGFCHTGTLIANLVTAMSAVSDSSLSASNVTRVVAADNSLNHLIRVTYTGTNLSRTVLITPAVAAFCP